MSTQSDFGLITFWEHLGDKKGDLSTSATWVGDRTTVRNFNIDGVPQGKGYVLVQAYDVHEGSHQILINGQALPGMDIPKEVGKWQTWMDEIPSGIMKQGNNTIQIRRDTSTGDNFIIRTVAIHWRETTGFTYYPVRPLASTVLG